MTRRTVYAFKGSYSITTLRGGARGGMGGAFSNRIGRLTFL
jgi:hypothetical protein